ncbi:glycoside hydrolase family 13 protein [Bifidobacterium boum]|uniref:Alpha amylase, catalytic region n=2 Tax=Bifidobacterium TaxID=1678 RepID=A0A086ZII7_9BIFI|nr:glycoside hydrolase family 13 protein [Bifidobacterium boum]KFI46337.1 alpha amylase, catalytic region [Bifidobacterium boum]
MMTTAAQEAYQPADGTIPALPHHDGSRLYVSNATPRLGETIRVRVRIPASNPYTGVKLHSLVDDEMHLEDARPILRTPDEIWYEAPLPVHNPVTRYRFALLRDGGFDWLNALGVFDREVSDVYDFRVTTFAPSPAWNREGATYQIFPDRFARSRQSAERSAPDWAHPTAWSATPLAYGVETGRQWYGGDLKGIEEHLEYIHDLGFTTVYLTPCFPARSVHRYDASTFDHIDPLLGGDEALRSLARACHARGMRIMGDLTLNHTGSSHEWFQRALHDPNSEERDYYLWNRYPDDYVAWMGIKALPKLNWTSAKLVDRMIRGASSSAGKWLGGESGLDGWRIDVANQTGRWAAMDENHMVATTIRHTVDELTDGNGTLIAEYMPDATRDLDGDGWQGVMNYAAFSHPLWMWVASPDSGVKRFGFDVTFPRRDGTAMVGTMRELLAQIPWKVAESQWNLIDSHDSARILTLTRNPHVAHAALGMMMTYPGVPMAFAGDERDAVGVTGEESRTPMDWDAPEDAHCATMSRYRDLLTLRSTSSALTHGGLRWVNVQADAVAYLREDANDRLLVVAARRGGQHVRVTRDLLGGGDPQLVCGEGTMEPGDHGALFTLPDAGYGIWRLGDLDVPRW